MATPQEAADRKVETPQEASRLRVASLTRPGAEGSRVETAPVAEDSKVETLLVAEDSKVETLPVEDLKATNLEEAATKEAFRVETSEKNRFAGNVLANNRFNHPKKLSEPASLGCPTIYSLKGA